MAPWTLALLGAPSVRGQCLEWAPEFGGRGVAFDVEALAVYDDGSGPALCAGGSFPFSAPETTKRIARWNGAEWSALAPPTNAAVLALYVFDAGAGPRLFAGGAFTDAGGTSASLIASWDGSAWSPLALGLANPADPSDGKVSAMTAFDDGAGPALYVAGSFTVSGSTSVRRVARWNGSAWSALANGFNGAVRALATHDDGTGPALYAAGSFTSASGVSANRIARWNGSSWSALSSGLDGDVQSLCVHDDGSGLALYAAGSFTTAGAVGALRIARWRAGAWSSVGGGADGIVRRLSACDTGGGAALYAAGDFRTAGGGAANGVARWDGSSWSALSTGVDARASALIAVGEGASQALYAGGAFAQAGSVAASRVARWSGADWSALGDGRGANDSVSALTVHDFGAGPRLFAGGEFTVAGGAVARRVASFDGAQWQALGAGMDLGVSALLAFDDGSARGAALYAGGTFTRAGGMPASFIAKWQANAWSPLGSGVNGAVRALAAFDDGTGGGEALHAAGTFSIAGGASAILVAKWDGRAWSPLGAGLGIPHFNAVFALATFASHASARPVLIAGGSFLTAGGAPAARIASWDGAAWSSLGSGTNGTVRALVVYDAGAGEGAELWAGGSFTKAGGIAARNVARWNGAFWSPLADGLDGTVSALGVFDDGSGPALYAGGSFALAGELEPANLARWDGARWTRVSPNDPDGSVQALSSFHDGSATGPDLCAGGTFTSIGGAPSDHVGVWRGCGAPGVGLCFGDGLDTALQVACPCGNVGLPYHGCANSDPALGGAQLGASGSVIRGKVLLTCRALPDGVPCAFLGSPVGIATGLVFGDGILCLRASALRIGFQAAGARGNLPHAASTIAPPETAGRTFYYQCHYRNPEPAFCTPAMFNVSNAYRIRW